MLTKNQALLGKIFFTNPSKAFYIQEIAKILGKKPGIFQRTLYNFEKEGILESEYRANARYFRVNKKYPLYRELKNIVLKTIGVEGYLRSLVEKFGGVEIALIYGSYPKYRESASTKIDLLLAGNVDKTELAKDIKKLSAVLHRDIRYTLYSKEEAKAELTNRDSLLKKALAGNFIVLRTRPDYFEHLVKDGPVLGKETKGGSNV